MCPGPISKADLGKFSLKLSWGGIFLELIELDPDLLNGKTGQVAETSFGRE